MLDKETAIKAISYLALKLGGDRERAKTVLSALLEHRLIDYDGASFTVRETDRALLAIAPELLNKTRLRELHDSGSDRSAWGTLCDAVHGELKAVSHQNDRHLIPELNHASPMRLERNPVRDAALAALQKPGVRDDAYWKNLEKNIEAYITGDR